MTDFRSDIQQIKKATIHFDLVTGENNSPNIKTYFGGTPYITDKEQIHSCPNCGDVMDFIFQFVVPEKQSSLKVLYSFYFCFECSNREKKNAFAMNVYRNPTEANQIETDYCSSIPYHEVVLAPAYDLPDWEFLEDVFPEVHEKIKIAYGESALDEYIAIEQQTKHFFSSTGFKFKGYPEMVFPDEVPLCPYTGKPMEVFIQMDCVPKLGMNWVGHDSYLLIFKSPDFDEFRIRTVNLMDAEPMADFK